MAISRLYFRARDVFIVWKNALTKQYPAAVLAKLVANGTVPEEYPLARFGSADL